MLYYVPKALTRFCHRKPCTPQHQHYSTKAQYTESSDTLPALPKEGKKLIQDVIGTFLYYARFTNSTMLVVHGSLATQQVNPTENTMAKVTQFLDYAATHPDAILTYHTNNLVLAGHSDGLYLSESNACSQVGGHFFVSNNTVKPPNKRCHSHYCANYQSSHAIGGGGRSGHSLNQL